MQEQNKLEILKKRHVFFEHLRRFFSQRDFIEVHTPLLVKNPGLEPHLHYFETQFIPDLGGGQKETLFLPTSPEYHLKKALALGLPKIFEITKSFRNGERSQRHEPEFFMLEWYRHPGELQDIAQDFAELLKELGAYWAPSKNWGQTQRLSVRDAFTQFCDLDLEAHLNGKGPTLTQQAVARSFQSVHEHDDFETTFNKLMIEKIEPRLGFTGPLFLWEYPASMCALAKLCAHNPLYCERFEVYWQGVELANAFGELTDPVEQRKRCQADQQSRMAMYGKSPPLDEEFFNALSRISKPAGGIAVGLERLLCCLLEQAHLQDVIAFPHWKSL